MKRWRSCTTWTPALLSESGANQNATLSQLTGLLLGLLLQQDSCSIFNQWSSLSSAVQQTEMTSVPGFEQYLAVVTDFFLSHIVADALDSCSGSGGYSESAVQTTTPGSR